MTEYKTGRTPHPKDAISVDLEGGLAAPSVFTQRVRKLERVVNDLAKAADEVGEDIGITDTTPEQPKDVRARLVIADTTVRWLHAKNSYTYEIRASDWADVEGAALAGTVNVTSFVHEDIGKCQYYWVRGVNANGQAGEWSDMVLATVGASDQQSVINAIISTSTLISSLRSGIEAASARLASIEGYLEENGVDPSGIIQRIDEGELPNALMETILFARKTRANARDERATIRQYVETKVDELGEATATELTQLEAKADSTISSLATEQTVRASQDNALASSITALSNTVAGNHASIVDILDIETTPEGAVAQRLNQIETDVGENTAAVQENSEAVAALDGTVSATHTIKVQAQTVGGKKVVAGIGLMADGTGLSEFMVAANRFVVVDPTDADGSAARIPFIIYNGTVYIDQACIREGTIGTALITDAAITNAKIANAAIKSANIEDAAITTAKIGNAQITKAKMASAYISDLQAEIASIAQAKIASAEIGWAQIDTAIAGNLEVDTAHIKKLTVDESNIVAGACTAANMWVNSYGGQLDGSWTTFCSASVTVTGTQTVYVQASGLSCSGSISGVGTWASHVRVMCGGTTVIPDTPCAHWSRPQLLEGLLMPFVLAGKFNPSSAGTYTFQLQARWPGGSYGSPSSGWESVIGRSSLSAWQFKK